MNNEVFDQAERGTRAIQAKQTFGAEVLKCEGAWLVLQEGGQICLKPGAREGLRKLRTSTVALCAVGRNHSSQRQRPSDLQVELCKGAGREASVSRLRFHFILCYL